ncbi:hypothetical protein BU26DRAFT_505565 [Trematosphaeria pertusa]|uniref:Uncharacterized protein n=1 Tax=Trematosphaeria pertusa TaxID=390896 RepID=A0A6A6IGM6_9PLEO|nr:uncharacterized protein BU26DRAFT_505565 [Trematosphaeria pertusa]KAF2249571.1 hypothetical protein BU26DRAFT_505565 [Trematosphaeria pertusa]
MRTSREAPPHRWCIMNTHSLALLDILDKVLAYVRALGLYVASSLSKPFAGPSRGTGANEVRRFIRRTRSLRSRLNPSERSLEAPTWIDNGIAPLVSFGRSTSKHPIRANRSASCQGTRPPVEIPPPGSEVLPPPTVAIDATTSWQMYETVASIAHSRSSVLLSASSSAARARRSPIEAPFAHSRTSTVPLFQDRHPDD